MNICKNCVHIKPFAIPELSECCHPSIVKVNIITGKVNKQFCNLARSELGFCGIEGKYFEKKETKK